MAPFLAILEKTHSSVQTHALGLYNAGATHLLDRDTFDRLNAVQEALICRLEPPKAAPEEKLPKENFHDESAPNDCEEAAVMACQTIPEPAPVVDKDCDELAPFVAENCVSLVSTAVFLGKLRRELVADGLEKQLAQIEKDFGVIKDVTLVRSKGCAFL